MTWIFANDFPEHRHGSWWIDKMNYLSEHLGKLDLLTTIHSSGLEMHKIWFLV